MGVPKFYRWISERYPKINQIVSDDALLPEFDHLYLDMNGIIHGCTHPSHMDVSDVLTEREMMLGIMQYLDRIITQIVKPKVSVYMAIDGVAPRAKLNQQRSRRFRSAKDLAEATKDLPKDAEGNVRDRSTVFDSNCITPGTEFLAKVSHTIQYFIRKKIKEDPIWHNLTIIFSGHDIPGEGEHKIMQHIREMRAQPGYKPNTRHCIYGQDADLIMLGLVTHEPHFTILREVIDFNFNNFDRQNTLKAVKKFTKESDFQLLHLSILREYLQFDFITSCINKPENNTENIQQPQHHYDLERVIDDFVFMTFLVGNDFLPHMPTLDIGDNAFDLLFNLYKTQRLQWGSQQYLTESGNISNPKRLEVFLAAIGEVESEILEQKEKDVESYAAKRRKWDKRDGKVPSGPSDAELKDIEASQQSDFVSMMGSLMINHTVDDFVPGYKPPTDILNDKDFKGRYYFEKLKMLPIQHTEHWHLRKSYMEGLIWCLAYYYRGCISWGWFYPYHYGPMLSDLIQLDQMFTEISFELGEPLTPFQQLMGCLPPASSALVPKLYRSLMTSPTSPIIHFYPESFEIDMNGKRNPWEGVNLLPFIDIKLLKETIASYCPDSKLSDVERKRNSIGKVYGYRFDPSCTDIVPSPDKLLGLPDISASSSSVTVIEDIPISSSVTFKPELLPGSRIPYPGFPSLNVFPIASIELKRIGLNCFGSPSKYLTMLMTMHEMPDLPALEVLAANVLGKSLFVNWPMMHEGQVIAISDCEKEIRLVKGKPITRKYTSLQMDQWSANSQSMYDMYFVGNGQPGAGGVNIGDVKVRIKVLPLQGMKTNPNGSTKKVFGKNEADVPLQLALWQAPAPDPRFKERGPLTLEDRFSLGCNVLLTKGKYRGCVGVTVGVADKKNVGVKVFTMPPEIPFGLAIARTVQESFVSSVDAAGILKIHPGVFGKVTGRLQFNNKYDLGLNLKSADGTCVVGYTRKKVEKSFSKNKMEDKKASAWGAGDSVLVIGSMKKENADGNEEKIQWEYTPKAIRLVEEFRRKFPQLFAGLKKKPNERKYEADDIFGPNGKAWLPAVREWLDNHETAKLPRTPVTTEAMSYEAVAAVQRAADARTLALKKRGFPKYSVIKVPGTALYREASTGPTDILTASDFNDNHAPELGDRIANLCANGIPFGARGTVVAIHEAATTGSVEVVMDEEFIGGTALQGACSNYRGKLCLWAHLLKITPENCSSYMDKLIPRGANQKPSQQTVNKIILSIDKQVKDEAPGVANNNAEPDKSIQAPPATDKQKGNRTTNDTPSTLVSTPKRPTSAAPETRAGSTGRSRKGAWREARGPDDNGIGFKGLRQGGVSGYQKWKTIVTKPLKKQAGTSTAPDVSSVEDDLKKKLGILSHSISSNATNSPSQTAASFELKAILGITPQLNSTPEVTAVPNPTQSLKAVLGVGSSQSLSDTQGLKALLGVGSGAESTLPSSVIPLQPENTGATAADKLLLMLSSKQPQGPGAHFMPMPVNRPSAFNFTYVDVEDGKETYPSEDNLPSHSQYPAPPPPPPPHFGGLPMHPPMGPHPGFYSGGVPPMPPPPPPHPGFLGGPMPPPFNPIFGFGPPPPPIQSAYNGEPSTNTAVFSGGISPPPIGASQSVQQNGTATIPPPNA